MENRRYSNCLADLCQSGSAIYFRRLRSKKSCLTTGNGSASGREDYYIMLDQFFTNRDMPLIQRGPGVVSPNHAGYTPYPAIYDIVIKGII